MGTRDKITYDSEDRDSWNSPGGSSSTLKIDALGSLPEDRRAIVSPSHRDQSAPNAPTDSYPDCPVRGFLAPDDRRTRANELKACFRCLETGHDARRCRTRKRYSHCSRSHRCHRSSASRQLIPDSSSPSTHPRDYSSLDISSHPHSSPEADYLREGEIPPKASPVSTTTAYSAGSEIITSISLVVFVGAANPSIPHPSSRHAILMSTEAKIQNLSTAKTVSALILPNKR
ncbi:hypothetical protein QR680_014239 [Steinernema hermaphroditum]|uniref:CCHC-type domain-containing protein n=1 Tax=Steinernema hermaphroditum TaxID=289476 RepID=A0AA39M3Q7_9BILA|nr:hypothetical protein QR680_014239 [Steinernema hermaphroditum]